MKILIIKLGALGDVLRTTPLLTALKTKYPESEIDWVTDPDCVEALEDNPLISALFPLSERAVSWLSKQKFDCVINLDKDAPALDCMMKMRGVKKIGFGRDADGKLCALDDASRYAYTLGIDDDLKFRKNTKTYQEIIFEQAGLVFNHEEYLFDISAHDLEKAKSALEQAGFRDDKARPVIGINTGSGRRFAGKKLPEPAIIALADMYHKRWDAQVLLLGGMDEIERNKSIAQQCAAPVINTGSHPIKVFAGIVQSCDLVVTGDTTAMHIAIAVKTPCVCFFGSTCGAEIELYGRGYKIVSEVECAPCYKSVCLVGEKCMTEMPLEKILELSATLLAKQ